jgi:micrococcal nuclease
MFNETLLEEGYAQVYTVSPNDRYEDRFEEAQDAAQEAEIGIWGLSSSEQDLLADRGNGIGGEECSPRSNSIPPPPPPPAPASTPDIPEPDIPEPDIPEPDVPEPEVPTPNVRPSAPNVPTPSSGADCSTGVKDVPVVPGSKGDRDSDGIACES